MLISSSSLLHRFKPLSKLGEGLGLEFGEVVAEQTLIRNEKVVRAKGQLSFNAFQQLFAGLLVSRTVI